ncbi:nuclear transport factor 2 family protein [Clostridium sp. AL.422]|uniref:nuclear transport factor 2 family protein n=1 Tax=Clostridium TaxID=1485 RepID=UPI00293DE1D0|nr:MULTISPECIES: nuclear transport factor 2 family protein [unclassified Clostridium]MDV4149909.1 nuclear transport factor 2 family protein [Clostridium sp. AL.422]
MKIKLQEPIETYFSTTNNSDQKNFISIFAEDAVVIDEGQEYVGLDKIQKWSEKHQFAAKIRLEATNVIEKNDMTIVTAKVDGDFDKTGLPDPLLLDFHFTVSEGMITKLEIY